MRVRLEAAFADLEENVTANRAARAGRTSAVPTVNNPSENEGDSANPDGTESQAAVRPLSRATLVANIRDAREEVRKCSKQIVQALEMYSAPFWHFLAQNGTNLLLGTIRNPMMTTSVPTVAQKMGLGSLELS